MQSVSCISLTTMRRSDAPKSSIICLGNFDGVHLAHRALMRQAREWKKRSMPDAACAVFCFARPSTDYLLASPPPHLYTLEQKLACFRDEGMDYAFVGDFASLRSLSAEEFVQQVLCEQCHASAAVCGFDYRFGKAGTGTAQTLRHLLNGAVIEQAEILHNGLSVSSTRIRHLLSQGDVKAAAELLTVPYAFSSSVLHGKALGRRLGFPTINQAFPKDGIIPAHGVYLTLCTLENGQSVPAISNVGVHPTVDRNASVNCESHLIGFEGDLYGQVVRIAFLERMRDEIKFESTEQLLAQVALDVAKAQEYFQKNPI